MDQLKSIRLSRIMNHDAKNISKIDSRLIGIIRRLNFRQLLYYCELCRFMNFRMAAESLGISQPTLSQQIAQLEQNLELSLLSRSTTGFKITTEGQQCLHLIQSLIKSTCEGLENIQTKAHQQELRVGIPSYQNYKQIDELLKGFKKAYPSIFTHLIELTAVEMCEELANRKLDIAFMSQPTPLELPKNLETLVFWSAPYELCLSKSHEMASKTVLTAQDVSQLPLILLPKKPHSAQYNFQIEALKEVGATPQIYPSAVTNVISQISLAASGAGACMVVPNTTELGSDVCSIPTDPPLPEMKMCIFWNKKNLNPLAERFILFAKGNALANGNL
ncbi:transcriptional regulator, LysR family [Pseudovibrio sp. FO-BEG1]|uniref:LysR family transcriptional regulator n=1 Tax=Pseudovibrio sp. (strain FO-BEG1) TaxID=911045 RepID=UPI000238D4C6|nr:transcriptional regulator, LysR family [Pseudovibrio sp. FO-BEG1]